MKLLCYREKTDKTRGMHVGNDFADEIDQKNLIE